LFEPGTWDTGGGPRRWTGKQYGPLAAAFRYEEKVEQHKGPLPGLMPLADLGCGSVVALVVSGPLSGRIWVDARRDTGVLHPEEDLDFLGWMSRWLDAAEHEVDDPWQPKREHENEPDRVIDAHTLIGQAAVDALVQEVRERLKTELEVKFGALGCFARRGGRQDGCFEQGRALASAHEGHPLPDVGPLSTLFRAALESGPWVAVLVPGLCRIFVRQDLPTKGRDYLGRPFSIGTPGLGWTVGCLLPRYEKR
jgi:hypothetical protein